MKTVAIVLAAGKGKRMNSDIKKQYLLLNNKPILYYSLKTFEESFIDEIIIVTGPDDKEYVSREIVNKYDFKKVSLIVCGGRERYNSVMNGLMAAGNPDYVFIHDGARPFITVDILERVYDEVKRTKAAVVGMPVKDTIKIVDKNTKTIIDTPNRNNIWLTQTPQCFAFNSIIDAYEDMIASETSLSNRGIKITDDAMVLETFGSDKVTLVEGSYDNIKITTPDDLIHAEAILREHSALYDIEESADAQIKSNNKDAKKTSKK